MDELITMLIKKKQEEEQMEQLKELAVGLELLAITSALVSNDSESSGLKPGQLRIQDLSALRLPDFDLLSDKLGMSKETYTRLKNRWGPLTKFDFKSNYRKFGDHTKEFYGIITASPTGRKRLYLGQVDNPSNKVPFGMGVRIYEDGEFEEGFWLNGKQHGYGRCIFPKGGVYQGHFKLDQKHGNGEYSYTSGEKFIGHYVNDNRDGEGVWHLEDGTVKKGVWIDNELEVEYKL